MVRLPRLPAQKAKRPLKFPPEAAYGRRRAALLPRTLFGYPAQRPSPWPSVDSRPRYSFPLSPRPGVLYGISLQRTRYPRVFVQEGYPKKRESQIAGGFFLVQYTLRDSLGHYGYAAIAQKGTICWALTGNLAAPKVKENARSATQNSPPEAPLGAVPACSWGLAPTCSLCCRDRTRRPSPRPVQTLRNAPHAGFPLPRLSPEG